MIVVDVNVIAYRALSGARSPAAERVEQKDGYWIVPPLWRCEFQNVLATAIKSGDLSVSDALDIWVRTAATLEGHERATPVDSVFRLVFQHRITAYDAQYMALAQEFRVPCVTEDQELLAKFPGIAVSMEQFAGSEPALVRERAVCYRRKRRDDSLTSALSRPARTAC